MDNNYTFYHNIYIDLSSLCSFIVPDMTAKVYVLL